MMSKENVVEKRKFSCESDVFEYLNEVFGFKVKNVNDLKTKIYDLDESRTSEGELFSDFEINEDDNAGDGREMWLTFSFVDKSDNKRYYFKMWGEYSSYADSYFHNIYNVEPKLVQVTKYEKIKWDSN